MKNLSLSIFYKENKFKRYLKLVFNKFINRSTQYGPDVVFLNLTNGLKKMNIKFLINPKYNRTFQEFFDLFLIMTEFLNINKTWKTTFF